MVLRDGLTNVHNKEIQNDDNLILERTTVKSLNTVMQSRTVHRTDNNT